MKEYIKYPRTLHAPWSLGVQSDDKVITSMDAFIGQEVVVTEKMDGENTTMYEDHIHARSIDSRHHPSRDWVKQFHATIAHQIPDGMRICGENVYAKHSIAYDNLSTYFYGFSIWYYDLCLGWDDTLEYFDLIGVTPVPVLYRGIYDEDKIKALWKNSRADETEGYVIRTVKRFTDKSFSTNMAKFVRANHVQTDKHWTKSEVIPNQLRKPVL